VTAATLPSDVHGNTTALALRVRFCEDNERPTDCSPSPRLVCQSVLEAAVWISCGDD